MLPNSPLASTGRLVEILAWNRHHHRHNHTNILFTSPILSPPSATTRPASATSATLSAATTAANVATSSATGTPAMRCRWTRMQTSTREPSPLAPATTASSSSRRGTAAKAARFPARHRPMLMARYHHLLLPSLGHLSACLRVLRFPPVCPATGTGAHFKTVMSQGAVSPTALVSPLWRHHQRYPERNMTFTSNTMTIDH
jgi:hypothetical protein